MPENDRGEQALLLSAAEEIRRVVVVRPGRIGDYLCATPALRALAVALPGAEITLVGLPNVADLVARSRHVHHLARFPGFPGIAEQWFDARRTTEFIAALQARHFDLAIQLYGSGRYSNPFTRMLGARWSAGFSGDGSLEGLDAAIALPEEVHEIERALALMGALGAPDAGRTPELALSAHDRREAEAVSHGVRRPAVVLHPAATDQARSWTVTAATHLGRAVRAAGGTVLVVGGAGERAVCNRIAAAAGGARDLSGRLTLPALAALMAAADLTCSTDSGPAHLAYAVGARSLTWFRATSPARWGPPPEGPHQVVEGELGCLLPALDAAVAGCA